MVGVGDTSARPGRICRNRLSLDRLSMFAGSEATFLENALIGVLNCSSLSVVNALLLCALTCAHVHICCPPALEKAHQGTQSGTTLPHSSQMLLVNDASVAVSTASNALRSLHQVRGAVLTLLSRFISLRTVSISPPSLCGCHQRLVDEENTRQQLYQLVQATTSRVNALSATATTEGTSTCAVPRFRSGPCCKQT